MEIKEAIAKLAEKNEELYSLVAKVTKVDSSKRVCEVMPIDDEDDKLYGVRLQASIEQTDGLVIYPKENSLVVVTFLNASTGYIALVSEVEKIEVLIGQKKLTYTNQGVELESNFKVKDGDKEIELDQQGIKIAGSAASLKSVLTELITTLSSLTVKVVGAIGTVEPTVVTQLAAIQGKLNSFLK
jgi:hypothetical protein